MKKCLLLISIAYLFFPSCKMEDNSKIHHLSAQIDSLSELISDQEASIKSLELKTNEIQAIARFANLDIKTQTKLTELVPFLGDCNACYQRIYGTCLTIGKYEFVQKCMEGRREAYLECLEVCKAYNTIYIE